MAAVAKQAIDQHQRECVEAWASMERTQERMMDRLDSGFDALHKRVSDVRGDLEGKISSQRRALDDWVAWAFRLLIVAVCGWIATEVIEIGDLARTIKSEARADRE